MAIERSATAAAPTPGVAAAAVTALDLAVHKCAVVLGNLLRQKSEPRSLVGLTNVCATHCKVKLPDNYNIHIEAMVSEVRVALGEDSTMRLGKVHVPAIFKHALRGQHTVVSDVSPDEPLTLAAPVFVRNAADITRRAAAIAQTLRLVGNNAKGKIAERAKAMLHGGSTGVVVVVPVGHLLARLEAAGVVKVDAGTGVVEMVPLAVEAVRSSLVPAVEHCAAVKLERQTGHQPQSREADYSDGESATGRMPPGRPVNTRRSAPAPRRSLANQPCSVASESPRPVSWIPGRAGPVRRTRAHPQMTVLRVYKGMRQWQRRHKPLHAHRPRFSNGCFDASAIKEFREEAFSRGRKSLDQRAMSSLRRLEGDPTTRRDLRALSRHALKSAWVRDDGAEQEAEGTYEGTYGYQDGTEALVLPHSVRGRVHALVKFEKRAREIRRANRERRHHADDCDARSMKTQLGALSYTRARRAAACWEQ